tara:strand:- start:83 stop:205 length:123 start_codon:yes stop_codon:yes gene_type:complete
MEEGVKLISDNKYRFQSCFNKQAKRIHGRRPVLRPEPLTS